jgi:UDP-3-O-[3-hydroxymyristoyl] glucosamine N-acyltransferase
MKRYIYKENGCKISRAALIGDGCVLGKGCVVEGTAVLQRTIVGRDCVVGSGAVVTESHLWAGDILYCFIFFIC